MRPISIVGAPVRLAARDSARASATFPPWLGRVATTWARIRAPVELVRPAELAAVHQAAIVQHDRARRGRTLDEPLRLQPLHLARKAERPGRGQLVGEALRGDAVAARLPSDQRMRPLDRHREPELFRGRHHVARVPLGHGERRLHAEHHRLPVHLDRLRLCERGEVRLDAAVQDRRLGAGQLDSQVVDLVRRYRGQEMLHSVNRRPAPADGGAALDRLDFGEARGDDGCPRQVGPPEQDPLARRRGEERRLGLGAGVQPLPRHRRPLPDGASTDESPPCAVPAPRGRRRSVPAGTAPPGRAGTRGGSGPGTPRPSPLGGCRRSRPLAPSPALPGQW